MKNQLKKSLSLIMAVLMVLSCWVWVAPTQAEAADGVTTPTEYKVTFNVKVTNADSGGGADWARVYYMPDNGTKAETYTAGRSEITFDFSKEDNGKDYSISVPGWPSAIYFETNAGAFDDTEVVISNIRINERTVVSGTWTVGDGGFTAAARRWFLPASRTGGAWNSGQVSSNEDKSDPLTEGTWNWPKPTIAGMDENALNTPLTINVPKVTETGNDSDSASTKFTNFVDQYGVVWSAQNSEGKLDLSSLDSTAVSYSFYMGNAVNATADAEWENISCTNNKNTATVTANANIQKEIEIKKGTDVLSSDVYVVMGMEYTDPATPSEPKTSLRGAKVNLVYPKYNWIFDVDGNTSESIPAFINMAGSAITADPTLYPEVTEDFSKESYRYYGHTIEDYYPVDAEKAGHTFMGFWSKSQPQTFMTTNNDLNKLLQSTTVDATEAAFIEPISSKNIADYKGVEGYTIYEYDNSYNLITEEGQTAIYTFLETPAGKLYYDAGVKWDPKTDREVLTTTGDSTWHAWWIKDDISIKFYDIDGAFLGEEIAKYNDTSNNIKWPTPKESYVSGPYTYDNFSGYWTHITGEEVNQNNYVFTKDLVLQPKYTKSFDNRYTITFMDSDGNVYSSDDDYIYREDITAPAANDIVPLDSDVAYTYEFAYWTTAVPSNGKTHHIVLEDDNFDPDGNAIVPVTDFIVRNDAVYYPAFRRYLRSYNVTFQYYNAEAKFTRVNTTYMYGDKITVPEEVVERYANNGMERTLKGWALTNGGEAVNMVEQFCNGTMVYYPIYSDPVPTPYDVTFIYRNEKGEEDTIQVQVNHGARISKATIDLVKSKVASEYDDGTNLLTYYGTWIFNEVEYEIDSLLTYQTRNHVTFTAVYEDPKPFYTATYVDGTNTEDFRVVTGTELPFWTVETTGEDGATTEAAYVPSREDTIEGEYEFLGWADQKQTEEQIETNVIAGNQYIPGTTPVTSNVTLYPQFGFKLFEYTYTFYNYNGTKILAEGTFHYGDSIGELKVNAETAAAAEATGKPADNTYTYKFIGWDRVVPSFCEGTDLSFIAQYQAQYIYYDIEWYNSALDADNNWVIDGEKLATSSYIYGDKLRAPSLTLEIPEYSDENQSYVLEGWYYKDENGNEQKFQRNMLLNESMLTDGKVKMYPKYALTARLYEVTVVVDEDTDYTVTVAAGATLTDLISEPASGYYDVNQHYGFDKWVTKAADGEETAYNLSEEVHSDLTLYATYSYQNHEYSANEVVTAPTYPVAELKDAENNILVEAASGEGLRAYWCECNKEKTYDDDKTNGINDALNVIPALTDSVAPESTAYIGTNKQLSIADAAAAEMIYVNPNTDLIITTSDKGDVNAEFNAAGTGIGVTSVALQIVEAATLNATTEDDIAALTGWQTMYDWPATQLALIEYYGTWAKVPDMYKNYNANASGKLSSYNLDNGTEYIAYFKIVDKAGNTSYMRSVKFFYDSIKPSMIINGDGNEATGVFCEGVTIQVFGETSYVVTANGTPVSQNEDDGLYHITEDGTYQLVVTDAAGNKSTAFFSVAPHNTRLTEIAATCFIDGYTTQKCLNCGTEFGVIEEIPCTGHLDLKVETTEATCTTNGYDTMTCSACGLEEVVDVKQDEEGNWGDLYPALGHNWSEWRVTKAATCSTEGLQRRTCSRCGEAGEENIATDSTAHNFYRAVVVRPTCTDAGRRTQTCRLCGYIDVLAQGTDATADNYNADYAAKGHDFSVEKVITEATCHSAGSKATYCATCGVMQEGSEAAVPATGLHVYVLNEDKSYEATGDAEGLAYYECSNEGCTAYYTNTIDKLAKYTIKFMSEDGSTVLKEIEKVVGETVDLTVDAVTEPTKANSADGKTRYEFAGWYTKDADGNYSSKPYAFPATVTGDATVYAKFTDKAIYYTVQFKAAETYTGEAVMFKELMGAIGDTRVPTEIPVIASDKMNDYEFLGWYRAGVEYSGIVSGDATYTAKFDAIAKAYDVIFMCEDVAVGKITVTAGGTATYAGETPTKASDADYHYIFTGWDGSLENITSKTTVYAEFEAVEHSFDVGEVTQQASCTLPELTKYTCGDCGYEKTVETKAALNHPTENLETTYDEESGKNVTTCTLCGTVVKEEAASYTIVFENWDGGRLDTLSANVNADFKYAADAAAEKATRKADEMYYYTFAGWAVKGTTDIVTTFVATENVTYVAQYTTTDRTYTVTFAKSDNSAVISFTGIAYGSTTATMGTDDTSDDIDVATYLFNAELFGIPAATSAGHSAYDKWDTDFADGVKKDMLVRPVYKLIAHNYDKNNDGQITEADAEMTQATCQHSGGYKYSCADCGYFYVDGIVDKLDHTWVEYKVDEPTYEAAGKSYQRCAVCGETREEVIPALTRIVINVTIKDTAGVAYEGAKVTITHAVSEKSYGPNQTNKEGVATFYVDEAGEYIVKVTGIEGHDGGLTGSITVDDSGKITKNELPQIQGDHSGACSCACHRTNFWGMLFRFFHKIIALIAGDYICCDCPDHRYFE